MKRYSFLILFTTITTLLSAEIITLDLQHPTSPAVLELNEQGYWKETYNSSTEFRNIEFNLFRFSHTPTGFGGNDVGGGMSYWDGFTYCTNGDNTDYGKTGDSEGWINNQWGCMAGGGIKTDENGKILTNEQGKVLTEKGIPYLVAYWGYWVEENENGAPCLQVNFTDNHMYEAQGMYVCNHPWPYYGNEHGDGFASPFDEEGDFFKLIIHGFNEQKEDIGITVEYTLAEFKDGELHQSPDWQWIDLSELGEVSGLYFTMESSDIHNIEELGPNTAVYFCMDKLTVKSMQQNSKPSRPNGLKVIPSETNIQFTWNASTVSTASTGIKGYNLSLNGGEAIFTEQTNYTFTGLSPYTEYKIEIEAISTDEIKSSKASITTQTTDDTPPSMPENLKAIATDQNISLSWNPSTDNVAVTEYHIYMNGERQKRVYELNYTLTGLDPATSYFIEVEARDKAGNRSKRASITVNTETTGNELIHADKTTDMYYNVSNNTVYVTTQKNSLFLVYDINGRILLSREIPDGQNEINIEHLPKGIYLIQNENNKIIINK